MARFKSVTARMIVDRARRSHKCQHSDRHVVRMGDARLKVTEDRTDEHFCRDCAIKMLNADLVKIQRLLENLEEEATAETA